MGDIKLEQLLEITEVYSGDGISVRMLEETIHMERTKQNQQVEELSRMRERNGELQNTLTDEIGKLRDISEQLHRQREQKGLGATWRNFLSKLPMFKDRLSTRQSIEDLLRRQYEMSAMRVKEAAEFVDRLDVAKADLYDEIERLNRKIIEYAENEETAASHTIKLSELKNDYELKLAMAEAGSLESREIQAELDKIKRGLIEHSSLLKLFDTAEERLVKLQENTRLLVETIAQLQSDISLYVTVASEKLDLIAGQIQAIGTAADASMVMLELKRSLESMTESVNHTTRFVSETQAYFRDNVDSMVDELNLYDEETEQVLLGNLANNEVHNDMHIEDAVSLALARQIEEAAQQSQSS